MKKRAKIAITVVTCVVVALFAAVMFYYFGASYSGYNKLATKQFSIPGLDTKFSPQGISYSQDNSQFVISGYMADGSASRLYFVRKNENSAYKYITLKSEEGALYVGHCGGVAVYGDIGYIVGEGNVYTFNMQQALSAKNGEAIKVTGGFESGNGADFVLTYNDQLIVGEFYHKKAYPTKAEHHIKTPDGKENPALSFVYNIDEDAPSGVASTTPVAAISMPALVQGMAFTKDKSIVLSTSYGLANSHLYVYRNVLADDATGTVEIEGNNLPLYTLYSGNELTYKSVTAPCMSEEMVLVDDEVYVLYESACSKYKWFTRTRTKYVYSLNI